MKLEAVNPVDPEEVCIATVTKLKDSYLWLQLEGKLGLGEERSALFGSAVVPSPNLRSIRSKLTVCRVWAASHNFLSEITVKTHLHCVFAVCLGWHCLFKPRMAFVHCSVSAGLMHRAKCWAGPCGKQGPCDSFTHEWLAFWASFGQTWGGKFLQRFFIKIE